MGPGWILIGQFRTVSGGQDRIFLGPGWILIGQFRTVSGGQDWILKEQLKNIGSKDKMVKCVKKFKNLESLFKNSKPCG